MSDEERIAEAVREQRQSGDKEFVYLRRQYRDLVGLQAELAAEARESGRLFVHEADAPTTREGRPDAKTVERGDNRAFLNNLAGIARGDVEVR